MKYQNEVSYRISTTFDKTGIAQLQTQLSQVQAKLTSLNTGLYNQGAYNKDIQRIKEVQALLTKNFSNTTGLLNLKGFTSGLNSAGISIKSLQSSLNAAGTTGQQAFNSLIQQTMSYQKGIRQTTTLTEKLGNTIGNTVRWGLVAGAFQEVMSSANKAVQYVEKLDESLTQITMVSGESRDNMKQFAEYANKAAASLGSATTDFTNATKIFIQEGFNLEESKKQATQATILGNVSEQDTATTADQITAYRNAFGVSIEGMNSSLDKLANLANNTASNVSELMTATQRTASTAASVGASEDATLASIATVQSITRESAEQIGNGLKSIYTRLADVKMGKTTDDNVGYGQYSSALKSAGVDIIGADGQVKDMDTILNELRETWKTLSQTQKEAVGEKVAGRYQYNRFAALMNNGEYYDKAYAATQNADGAMEEMQKNYMEGIAGQSQKIATNIESIFTAIYQNVDIEKLIGAFAEFSTVLSDIFSSIDSATPIVSGFLALLMKLGGQQMATGISNMMANANARRMERSNEEARQQNARRELIGRGMFTKGGSLDDDQKQIVQTMAKNTQYNSVLTKEEIAARTELEEKVIQLKNENIALTEKQFVADTQVTAAINQRLIELGSSEQIQERIEQLGKEEVGIANALSEEERKQYLRAQNLIKLWSNRNNLTDDQKNKLSQALEIESKLNQKIENEKIQRKEEIKLLETQKEVVEQIEQAKANGQSRLFRQDIASGFESGTYTMAAKEGLVAFTQLKGAVEQVQGSLMTLEATTGRSGQEILEAQESASALSIRLKELAESGKFTAETENQIIKASELLARAAEGDTDALADAKKAMDGLYKDSKIAIEALTVMGEKAGISREKIQGITTALIENKISLEQAIAALQAYANANVQTRRKMIDFSKAIGSIANVVMNISMMYSSITSAMETFSKSEATAKEKTEAMVSALTMTLMSVSMLAPGIINTIKSFVAFNKEAKALAATGKILIASDAAQAVSKEVLIAAGIEEAVAEKILAGAILEEAEARAALKAVEAGGLPIKVADKDITAAMAREQLLLNSALMESLVVMLPIIVGLTVLAGAIWGIIETQKRLDKSIHSANTRLEEQQKSLKTLESLASNLKTAYDDLNSGIQSVFDQRDSLKEMTRGTEEWEEAVRKLNLEILELINQYPELAKYMSNKDGVFTLDENAVNDYIESKYEDTINAQNAATSLNAKINQTKTLAKAEDFADKWVTNANGQTPGYMKGAAIELAKVYNNNPEAMNEATKSALEHFGLDSTDEDLVSELQNIAIELSANTDALSNNASITTKYGTELSKSYDDIYNKGEELVRDKNFDFSTMDKNTNIYGDVSWGDILKAASDDIEDIDDITKVWKNSAGEIVAKVNGEDKTVFSNETEAKTAIESLVGQDYYKTIAEGVQEKIINELGGAAKVDNLAQLDYSEFLDENTGELLTDKVEKFADSISDNDEELSAALKSLTSNILAFSDEVEDTFDWSSGAKKYFDNFDITGEGQDLYREEAEKRTGQKYKDFEDEKDAEKDKLKARYDARKITKTEYEDALDDLNEELENFEDRLNDVTEAMLREETGFDEITSVLDESYDSLQSFFSGTIGLNADLASSYGKLKTGIEDLLNIEDASMLDQEFLKNNMELLRQAVTEGGDALVAFRIKAAGKIAEDLDGFDELINKLGKTKDTFYGNAQAVEDWLRTLHGDDYAKGVETANAMGYVVNAKFGFKYDENGEELGADALRQKVVDKFGITDSEGKDKKYTDSLVEQLSETYSTQEEAIAKLNELLAEDVNKEYERNVTSDLGTITDYFKSGSLSKDIQAAVEAAKNEKTTDEASKDITAREEENKKKSEEKKSKKTTDTTSSNQKQLSPIAEKAKSNNAQANLKVNKVLNDSKNASVVANAKTIIEYNKALKESKNKQKELKSAIEKVSKIQTRLSKTQNQGSKTANNLRKKLNEAKASQEKLAKESENAKSKVNSLKLGMQAMGKAGPETVGKLKAVKSSLENIGPAARGAIQNINSLITALQNSGKKNKKKKKDKKNQSDVNAFGDGTTVDTYAGNDPVSSSDDGGGSDDKDDIEKNIDPYQEVNEQLEIQENKLKEILELNSKLYGSAYTNNQKNYRKGLEKEISLLNKKAKIAANELKEQKANKVDPDNDKATLGMFQRQYKLKGQSTFNKDGSINQKWYESTYNKIYKKGDSDKLSEFEDAISRYEETLKLQREIQESLISQYETYINSIKEQQEASQKYVDSVNNLQKSFASLSAAVDSTTDAFANELAKANRAYSSSNDNFNLAVSAQLQAQAKYDELAAMNDKYTSVTGKYKNKKYTLAELEASLSNEKLSEKDRRELEAEVAKWKKNNNVLYSQAELNGTGENSLSAAMQTIVDTTTSVETAIADRTTKLNSKITAISNEISNHLSEYETILKGYNSLLDISKLIDDKDYAKLAEYSLRGYDTTVAKFNEQTENILKLKELKEQFENAAKQQNISDTTREDFQNRIAETEKQILSAEIEQAATEKESLEKLKTYTDYMKSEAYKVFLSEAFGMDSLDWYNTQWTMNSENIKNFYDNYESAYQKSNLKFQYQQLKNSTRNLDLQKEISDQMNQQMEYLENQVELSKFDVEYAEKKLAVLKAQIALEEAQANKSKLKLTRDSAGNYTYTYGADKNEIEEAQNNLAKAKNDAYETLKNQINTIATDTASYLSTYQSRVANEKDSNKLAEITASAQKYLADKAADIKEAMQIAKEDFNISDYAAFGIADNNNILDSLLNNNGISASLSELTNKTMDAQKLYDEKLASASSYLEASTTSIDSKLGQLMDGDSTFWQGISNNIEDIGVELISLAAVISEWSKNSEKVKNQETAQIQKSWQDSVATSGDAIASSTIKSINAQVAISGTQYDSRTGNGNGVVDVGDKAYVAKALNLYANKGDKVSNGTQNSGKYVTVKGVSSDGGWINTNKGWVKISDFKNSVIGFNTGGYTGAWANGSIDGRVALLHQKELVLNAEQTEHILAAANVIDNINSSMFDNVGDISTILSNLSTGLDESVEQNIVINADFPGVQDSLQIQDALLNLTDRAYQRVNKNYQYKNNLFG